MTWEPFAWFVSQIDAFKMPEPGKWLVHGKAVLSLAAKSWENNSLRWQLEASGVFPSGLACVVDILTFGYGLGFAVGESPLQPADL